MAYRAFNFGVWVNGEAAGELPEPFKDNEDKTRKFSEVSFRKSSRELQTVFPYANDGLRFRIVTSFAAGFFKHSRLP
jgi:hypothetical protein